MEKEKQTTKSKNMILKFLPKAAQAAVSFQNPLFSPGRDKRPDLNYHNFKAHVCKGFSGSIIPADACGRSKNFETKEPTSPKVSCIGQIKHKKNQSIKKHASLPKEFKPKPEPEKITKIRSVGPAYELKKKPSGIMKILNSRRNCDARIGQSKPPLPDRARSLSQMRRFASSRDTLANFDWTTSAYVASVEDRDFYSDEDRDYSDGEDDLVFSAPITGAAAGVIGGLVLEPRKEINLWKRRTMAQPEPLQLNIVRAQ